MEHMLYWLWLTTKTNMSSDKISRLFMHFDTIEDIYFARSYNNMRGISPNTAAMLMEKDLSAAELAMEETLRLGGKILLYDDENYPEILKNIDSPPYVLYVQGKFPNVDELLTIGVVGTRYSTSYGEAVTERISRSLVEAGAVTVSGMALGIDTVSAWTTIDSGGIAIGVIGCGIDRVYPSENLELARAMLEKGCIISEYPPGTQPKYYHFPQRNRIIAGLSRGILVTEAPSRSGSLITARYAMENNRDVFSVPRNITDTGYQGTNELIRQGAKLVCGAGDILSEYPYAKKVRLKEEIKNADAKFDSMNEKNKAIITLIKKADMQPDEISRELNLPINDVNMRLMLLEVDGCVEKLAGGRYRIK